MSFVFYQIPIKTMVILEKIESGDTTVKWVDKKKKVYSNNNKSTDSQEKTIENYGLKMEK